MILNGKDDQNSVKIKTTAIFVWYFGYEFVDTLLCLTKKSIILLASDKKLFHLSAFKDKPEFKDHNMIFLVKDTSDNKQNFTTIFNTIQKDSGSAIPKIGSLTREK